MTCRVVLLTGLASAYLGAFPRLPSSSVSRSAVTLLDDQPVRPGPAPFGHGEILSFDVTWMGIPVGALTLQVEAGQSFEGHPAIHLKGSATSNKAFSLFFSVSDAGESWIDPQGLYSLGFLSDQNEGTLQDRQRWVLDNERALAIRERVRKNGQGMVERTRDELPLSRVKLQDAASMLYYYRAFPLRPGSVLSTQVFVDEKIWDLSVGVDREEETVKTPAGAFRCLKVRPRVSLDGVEQNKGEMTVWVSEDERRIPVKMVSRLPFGKVDAELTRFHEGT